MVRNIPASSFPARHRKPRTRIWTAARSVAGPTTANHSNSRRPDRRCPRPHAGTGNRDPPGGPAGGPARMAGTVGAVAVVTARPASTHGLPEPVRSDPVRRQVHRTPDLGRRSASRTGAPRRPPARPRPGAGSGQAARSERARPGSRSSTKPGLSRLGAVAIARSLEPPKVYRPPYGAVNTILVCHDPSSTGGATAPGSAYAAGDSRLCPVVRTSGPRRREGGAGEGARSPIRPPDAAKTGVAMTIPRNRIFPV